MKTRGTLGGIILSFDAQDTPKAVQAELATQSDLISATVFFEVTAHVSWQVLMQAANSIRAAGGKVESVRPLKETKRTVRQTPFDSLEEARVKQEANNSIYTTGEKRMSTPRGETVIMAKTVRSGGYVTSTGSVIVLGDVNAGAEIIANDDIIVTGVLRGVAHAGANGNDTAIIWAKQILSPQLRISTSLAQAGEDAIPKQAVATAEIAQLIEGNIVLRPWVR